jgi:hypothetical protein
MLYTIAMVLIILWLLGLVTGTVLGGFFMSSLSSPLWWFCSESSPVGNHCKRMRVNLAAGRKQRLGETVRQRIKL